MEIEDANGNRVTVTEAHWKRWPQLADVFTPVKPPRKKKTLRPVADETDPSGSTEPPTGDKTEEK